MTSHVNVYVKPSAEHSGPRSVFTAKKQLQQLQPPGTAGRTHTVRRIRGRVPFFFFGKKTRCVDVFQLAGTQPNICPVRREQLGAATSTLCVFCICCVLMELS